MKTNSVRITATLLAALLALPASAQDLGLYNRALSAFNAGNYEDSAQTFFEVNTTTTDPDLRQKSEYYLAASLHKNGLPAAAFIYFATIVKAGKAHPFYLKSVEGLVNVQDQIDDQFLIPNFLNSNYSDEWATLPVEVLARINYMIAGISLRRGKFDEAREFLQAVPKESTIYAKSQYLLGIVLIDPRFPGGSQTRDAVKAFETVRDATGKDQKDLQQTKYLAVLGLGRAYYGVGEYQKATDAYESIPRFSKYWDQALFENGFSRFQNDDLGGALGSLQALHAPQFAGAFQPESWILKSTVYYFSCLYAEAKSALAAFDELYLPMAEQLKLVVEAETKDPEVYFRLVDADETGKIPRPVLNWVRANERMLGMFAVLKEIDDEKKKIDAVQSWRSSKLGAEVISYLDQNRATLVKTAGTFAKNRLEEAYRNVKGFADQAEIIRFETSKQEKELAEAGVNQTALLKQQTIFRPKMPAENWNYWKFQGEFWRDEIGYYQYTLKTGCPGDAKE
jgi:tetratricopeptide (TPR) repeat protein